MLCNPYRYSHQVFKSWVEPAEEYNSRSFGTVVRFFHDYHRPLPSHPNNNRSIVGRLPVENDWVRLWMWCIHRPRVPVVRHRRRRGHVVHGRYLMDNVSWRRRVRGPPISSRWIRSPVSAAGHPRKNENQHSEDLEKKNTSETNELRQLCHRCDESSSRIFGQASNKRDATLH